MFCTYRIKRSVPRSLHNSSLQMCTKSYNYDLFKVQIIYVLGGRSRQIHIHYGLAIVPEFTLQYSFMALIKFLYIFGPTHFIL